MKTAIVFTGLDELGREHLATHSLILLSDYISLPSNTHPPRKEFKLYPESCGPGSYMVTRQEGLGGERGP